MPSAHPSFTDERLLQALERAFGKHADGAASIDAEQLRSALGLKSEYLARRVLSVFDANGDGVIDRAEFLAGVRRLVFDNEREKLLFAFRLHDHDGDGTVSETEMLRMIAMSLAESDVAEKASQSPERLTHSLFLAADRNRDGKISFEEFEAVVGKRPELLRKMVRSEALWISPSEDLLAGIDGETGKRRGRFARFAENHWLETTLLVAWGLANVGIFLFVFLGGQSVSQDQTVLLGHAAGVCIEFNGALILIPVMRRLMTRVRASFLGRMFPVDEAIPFHRILGHTLFVLALVHSALLVASYTYGHPHSNVGRLFFFTTRGLTGTVLLLVFAVMWACALGVVRRSQRFELFYFTHLLYIAWFVIAIVHAPSFVFAVLIPLVGFVFEQVLGARRRALVTPISSGHALRSGVTRLEFRKPEGFVFAAGDYVFLKVPEIARREWHPFTISSAPESAALTVHVRSLGNWTAALRRRIEAREASGNTLPMEAYLDGPYGSPSGRLAESRYAVLIGAGIGVTPFASVLESLVLREQGAEPSKLEKAYFFWLNRDQYSFEWFRDLLAGIEKSDQRELLDIHLCMTGARAGATSLGLELARDVLHSAGRSDLITGLRTHTHLGHPDFDSLLAGLAGKHQPARVDVFFCGPPGLATKIRRICEGLGMPFYQERF